MHAKSIVCYKNYRFEIIQLRKWAYLKMNKIGLLYGSWAFLDLDLTKAFAVCYIAAFELYLITHKLIVKANS